MCRGVFILCQQNWNYVAIVRALRHYNSPPFRRTTFFSKVIGSLDTITLISTISKTVPLSTLERSDVWHPFCSWIVYRLIELCISRCIGKSSIKGLFFDNSNMKEKICGHFDLSSVERGTATKRSGVVVESYSASARIIKFFTSFFNYTTNQMYREAVANAFMRSMRL